MFSLYGKVAAEAARNATRAWPVAFSLVAYALIIALAGRIAAPLGMPGLLIIILVAAACWSSYLELIAQAVAGSKIRVSWDEFKRTFGARFWDVISVMFAVFVIGYLGTSLSVGAGRNGVAVSAIFGIAVAFFFNAVPELLYQGRTRSFWLLMASARFMLANPVVWLLPNLVLAALALGASGRLQLHNPAELLIAFGNTFSSPIGVADLFSGLPLWALPIALFALHYVMVFRGILFRELTSGTGGNARLRAFQATLRR